MKNFILVLATILISIASLAQIPSGINYQTVVRDGDGNELANVALSLQMSIRDGAPNGTIVYVETHDVTSNSWGLVNLVVGNGTVESGDFSDINWGVGEKYLETAIDTDGQGNYTVLGVTQFLSVPYSLHASNGNYSMTTEERDALVDPPLGMQIFNITTNCLNYFNGYGWYETCGDCTPMPSPSNAGPDQYFPDATTATTLDANTPEYGTGTWSVVSGDGASFEDVNDPNTLFTGEACQVYDLKWTITSTCGATEDLVNIEFDTPPSPANAGPDQTYSDATVSTSLEGNMPEVGTGTWSVEAGNNGSFDDANNPTALFTGDPCETYVLKWTISNPCGTSEDQVEIVFNTPPTPADAGPDQYFEDATIATTLEGNTPLLGLGSWSVETGSGGSFENANDPITLFTGTACETYMLKWTISNPCGTSEDQVEIVFNTPPTPADAGPDQYFEDATIATALEGNTPLLGFGTWSVETGSGGSFENVNEPTTLFTGAPCETYMLKWIITNPCGISEDQVEIVFNTPPTPADAGPDQYFEDATIATTLQGNTPLLGLGTWSVETGSGGSFENINAPTTLFTGTACETYMLKWTISNPCGISEDQVEIVFNTPPTPADAGPDQLDVVGTGTSLEGNTPIIGTGQWSILSGTGGNIAEPGNPFSTFTGTEGGTYELQWMISNNCGSGADNVTISFAGGGGEWTCGEPYTDTRDGQEYETVLIGGQCWMAENLAYLPSVSPSGNGSTSEPYYYVYDYQGTDVEEAKLTPNFQTYGTLYNYPASQIACPDGWNNPSDDEWKILEGTVDSLYPVGDPEWDGAGWRGFDAGKNLKATSGWDDDGNGVDLYNFSALPGGYRYSGGFGSLGNQGMWWSSTEKTTTKVWGRNLWIGDIKSARYDYTKERGRAVRCLKSGFVPSNQAPDLPTSPNPEDGAINQAIEGTTLSWTCTDPENDPLTYDVYFGTENPPTQVATGQSETSYDPGMLQYETGYFWKVVAHDDQGNSTEGLVWSYTTEEEMAQFSCGDLFTDSRDGNTYETVQIGEQCWMAENLNYQVTNSFCYNNESANCDIYGRLYTWSATVDACPDGWHLSSDEEWKILEGTTDSEFGVGDPEWDILLEYRGSDAGTNLKATTGWSSGNGNDAFGFTALPVGYKQYGSTFTHLSTYAGFWTSTPSVDKHISRGLYFELAGVYRGSDYDSYGYSVRCLKSAYIPPNQAPDSPSSPNPEDGATNQAIEGTTLSWTCTDPESDPLTYDVYLSDANPPAFVTSDLTEATYDPGMLEYMKQYFWKIVATDDQGNSTEGPVWTFTTMPEQVPFVCGDSFIDERDNNQYSSVQIGTQCWMAENLQIGTRIDGSVDQTNNASIEKYCYSDNDANCDEYGGLYQWDEMMQYLSIAGMQGICPEGWHVPADDEWCTLENYVDAASIACDATGWRGNDAGGNLKETGFAHWNSPNTGATNTSGFTGIGSGLRGTDGSFDGFLNMALYWSSSESGSKAWGRYLGNDNAQVFRGEDEKNHGFSVRCVKD